MRYPNLPPIKDPTFLKPYDQAVGTWAAVEEALVELLERPNQGTKQRIISTTDLHILYGQKFLEAFTPQKKQLTPSEAFMGYAALLHVHSDGLELLAGQHGVDISSLLECDVAGETSDEIMTQLVERDVLLSSIGRLYSETVPKHVQAFIVKAHK